MNSLVGLTILGFSILGLISSCFSMRNKNPKIYQTILQILFILSLISAFFGLEIISMKDENLNYAFFSLKTSFVPVLASLYLIYIFATLGKTNHLSTLKKTLGLLSFFFIGVILTNPVHNLSFSKVTEPNLFVSAYTPGMMLKIAYIYSSICIIIGFLTFVIALAKNTFVDNKLRKFLAISLGILTLICGTLELKFDILYILLFVISILIYAFVLKVNDFNIIPLIRSNTFELLNEGILVCNHDLIIKDFNRPLKKLFTDIDFNNVIGKKIEDVFKFYPVVAYVAKNQKTETTIVNGKTYAIDVYSSIEKNKRNTTYTLSFKLESPIAASLGELNDYSTIDRLTQLKKNEVFIEMLTSEFNKSSRYNFPFVIAYLDIDNFRNINEEYGHIAGDLVLSNIASIIKKEIRKSDILARVADDNFGLILAHTNANNCELVVERIRKKIENNSLAYDGKLIKATISIGVCASNDPQNSSVDKYIKKAEDALQKAKLNGKNCVVVTITD